MPLVLICTGLWIKSYSSSFSSAIVECKNRNISLMEDIVYFFVEDLLNFLSWVGDWSGVATTIAGGSLMVSASIWYFLGRDDLDCKLGFCLIGTACCWLEKSDVVREESRTNGILHDGERVNIWNSLKTRVLHISVQLKWYVLLCGFQVVNVVGIIDIIVRDWV